MSRHARAKRHEVTKTFTFDAAHQLPNHAGKCQHLHGHTYRVEVTVTGKLQKLAGASDEGMVVDFGVLSAVWREQLEPLLDHQFLNDTLAGEVEPTTAENLAAWLLKAFAPFVSDATGGRSVVTSVAVYETPTSCAVARV